MNEKKSFNEMANDAISIHHDYDVPYILTTKQIEKIAERDRFHLKAIVDGFYKAMLEKGFLVTALPGNRHHVHSLESMADEWELPDNVLNNSMKKIAKEKNPKHAPKKIELVQLSCVRKSLKK